ncbi:GAF domain-containing protein [Cupriavidus necator]|uniref:GAF domain-containing protein n=1 Tax=Cupriavidus necator TaxID=106590 RepID=UPI00148F675D|nr:GAF domain-containing protein [Cupriavidus necator]
MSPLRTAVLVTTANDLCDQLQQARDPAAAFAAIGAATLQAMGPGLLTINAWHAGPAQIERLWSSDPSAYPVGGRKSKGDSAWRRQLLERGEVFVGEGDAALAAVFDDVQVIRGLGCTAVVNVPLCVQGRVIGTFNYLADRTVWSETELVALRVLGALATPAVGDLLAAQA